MNSNQKFNNNKNAKIKSYQLPMKGGKWMHLFNPKYELHRRKLEQRKQNADYCAS